MLVQSVPHQFDLFDSPLEPVLQSELNLTHRDRHRSDGSRYTRSVVDEVVRLREVRVIQSIEELRAELDSLLFGDCELLAQREIEHVLSWSYQRIPACIPEGEPRRWHEGIDIEPMIRGTLIARQVAIAYLVRSH